MFEQYNGKPHKPLSIGHFLSLRFGITIITCTVSTSRLCCLIEYSFHHSIEKAEGLSGKGAWEKECARSSKTALSLPQLYTNKQAGPQDES